MNDTENMYEYITRRYQLRCLELTFHAQICLQVFVFLLCWLEIQEPRDAVSLNFCTLSIDFPTLLMQRLEFAMYL